MRGLAGSRAAKVKHLFGLCKDFTEKICKVSAKKQVYLFFLPSRSQFYAKSAELEVIFNRCWVFRDAVDSVILFFVLNYYEILVSEMRISHLWV